MTISTRRRSCWSRKGTKVAFVVCDLISLSRPIVEQARKLITDSSSVRGENVMMSATHSHTGPVLRGGSTRNAAQGGEEDVAMKYAEELPRLIAESVKLAAERLTNAVVSAAIGYEEHLSFNRRFFMRDGTVAWNPARRIRTSSARPGPSIRTWECCSCKCPTQRRRLRPTSTSPCTRTRLEV